MTIVYRKKLLPRPKKILEGWNLQKFGQKNWNLILSNDFGFYIVKMTFMAIKKKCALILEYFTFLDLCWTRLLYYYNSHQLTR